MPSSLPDEAQLGVKVVSVFAHNQAAGLPRIQALMLLLDGTNGRPIAILDGAALTALRTGAASGAATDLLANPGADTVAIFGAMSKSSLVANLTALNILTGSSR